MVYNQLFILLFSFLAVMLIAGLNNVALRHFVLVVTNLAFLFFVFYWNSKAFVLVLAFLSVHFLILKSFAVFKEVKVRGRIVAAIVVLDLSFLAYFNYPFLLQKTSWSEPTFFILVGLGFLILRLIHLTVDSGKNVLTSPLTGLRFFNYLLFFPAYLSGSLARFDDFVTGFERPQPITSKKLYLSLQRVIIGFFKIQFLAYAVGFFSIHQLTDQALLEITGLRLIVSLVGYTLWLYFSFSGVCDIAIGISQLLGVALPENFNRPFLAANVQQFWQRWHISLMDWVSLYLYQPLLISIKMIFPGAAKLSVIISLFVTFCLVGLWHGDAFHFLYYGLFHALGLILYFSYAVTLRPQVMMLKQRSLVLTRGFQILSWGLTWAFIACGWFIYLGKEEILLQRLRMGIG